MKLRYFLLIIGFTVMLQLAFGQILQHQTITIQLLAADDKKPIARAQINLPHQNITTSSDESGRFILVYKGTTDTLHITHLGFVDLDIPLSANFSIQSTLLMFRKINELDSVEIVANTGLQQVHKERATGSFTVIDNKLYHEQVGTNVLERLKYITNGVVPISERISSTGGSDKMLIRGLSTLTMPIQKPLVIIDNFEYQGDIQNINPNDVFSVTFLKDAAAGSIWGAKAGNGVIVITTKKGNYRQRTTIDINSNITIGDKPDLFSIPLISSNDLVEVEKYLFSQKRRFSDTASTLHPPFSPAYEILFKELRGDLSSSEAEDRLHKLRSQDIRNDYYKYFLQQSVNQQYALGLTGGSDNISWALSAGFDKNLSNLSDSYQRTNLRFNNTYKPFPNLEVNISGYYTTSQAKPGNPAFGSLRSGSGIVPTYTLFADEKGNPIPLYNNYRQGYIDTLGAGKLMDWRYYPLTDQENIDNSTNLTDYTALIGVRYALFKGLNIEIKYQYGRQLSDNRILYTEESYFTRNLINNYSQLDRASGKITYNVPRGDILDIGTIRSNSQNVRGQLNYSNQWDSNEVVALIGTEASEAATTGNTFRTYGFDPDILIFGNVDYANQYPLFIRGRDFIPNNANFNKTNTRFLSFFANAAYTYKSKYTLSGSIRRDASNLFGVDYRNKWKPLWSIGAKWEIEKEHFYSVRLLPELKMRVTYGYQGNIDPSMVAVTTVAYQGEARNPYTGTPIANINNFANPDLRWEQVGMFNAAIDFAGPKRRISGSIEFYKKNISDLYAPYPIDVTTGLGTDYVTRNVGRLRGSGWDIEINTINLDGNFQWSTNFIFNTYKDKVVRYYYPKQVSGLVGRSNGIEGYSPLSLFAYRWAGLDPLNGDPIGYLSGIQSKDWRNITGSGATLEDIKYVGSLIPITYGSIGNTFRWQNIILSARITYKFNYYFMRESINYSSLVNSNNGHSDFGRRWQKPGDETATQVPSFLYPINSSRESFYANSEILATKGDHIRLQYLNLSYELPRILMNRTPLKNIRIFAVANDIGILWRANHHHLDPDFTDLSPSKSFSFGIDLTL